MYPCHGQFQQERAIGICNQVRIYKSRKIFVNPLMLALFEHGSIIFFVNKSCEIYNAAMV